MAISQLREKKLLEEVRMTPAEYAAFLAVGLGPGESAAIAIARRAPCVVLDDRLGRRHAHSDARFPFLGSSLTLMLTSAYRAGSDLARTRTLVEAALTNSKMGVPREDRHLLRELLR